jgi:hypothetical protein
MVVSTYTIEFDRIGRSRSEPPLTVAADGADIGAALVAAVHRHVLSKILSNACDVDLETFDPAAGTGTGGIYAGGRPAGKFRIAPAAGDVTVSAAVPPELFSTDHWSTFAYLETRAVDNGGVVEHERMRCDSSRHPLEYALRGDSFAHNGSDGSRYPTRLGDGTQLAGHDDYDCAADLEVAGLVERLRADAWLLTPAGRAVAAQLRSHMQDGGTTKTFRADLEAAAGVTGR